MIENRLGTQEVAQTPGLIATDSPEAKEKREAELAAKFETVRGNTYNVGLKTIKINSGKPEITPKEDGEVEIVLKGSIKDPNAKGDFQNSERWTTFKLAYDKNKRDFKFSSRILTGTDGTETYYQIHEGELNLLKQTDVMKEALGYINNL